MNANDKVRLQHMLDYAQDVIRFTEGRDASALEDDVVLERALRYSIGIIGEAASHISTELRDQSEYIPWADIIGMRNFLFHAYFKIEPEILWQTAVDSIPELAEQLEVLLD